MSSSSGRRRFTNADDGSSEEDYADYRKWVVTTPSHRSAADPVDLLPHPAGDATSRRLDLTANMNNGDAPCGESLRVLPRVRVALEDGMGGPTPSIGTVARSLAVHPRTLQRQLAAEDTSFAVILDEVRREAALHYLTTTEVSVTQVAYLLGLSAPSVLTRCCRRWFDRTPSEIRGDTGSATVSTLSQRV